MMIFFFVNGRRHVSYFIVWTYWSLNDRCLFLKIYSYFRNCFFFLKTYQSREIFWDMKSFHEMLRYFQNILILTCLYGWALFKNGYSFDLTWCPNTFIIAFLIDTALISCCCHVRTLFIFNCLSFLNTFDSHDTSYFLFKLLNFFNIILHYYFILRIPFDSNFCPAITNPTSLWVFPNFTMLNIFMAKNSRNN